MAPDLVLVGDTVSVTLHARGLCRDAPFPTHVAVVLDASASMGTDGLETMRLVAVRFVRGFGPSEAASRRAAVVQFDEGSRTLTQVTGDAARIARAFAKVGTLRPPITPPPRTPPAGGALPGPDDRTAIDLGLDDAYRALVSARRLHPHPDDISEIVLLFSDGRDPRGCDPALDRARDLKANGVRIMAVCVGPGCDDRCLCRLASGPRYCFRAEPGASGPALFPPRDPALAPGIRSLCIETALGPGLAFDAGSGNPPVGRSSAGGLQWCVTAVPTEGVTVSFRARVLEPGTRPLTSAAAARLVDERGRAAARAYPERWLSAW